MLVEFLDPQIPDRKLGINDRIDDEAIAIGGTRDSRRGPRDLAWVFRHDVEKDVGVYQYGGHSVIAGQRHDGVGAHRDVAAAAQVGAATNPLAGPGGEDAHNLGIEFHFVWGDRPACSRISAGMVT